MARRRAAAPPPERRDPSRAQFAERGLGVEERTLRAIETRRGGRALAAAYLAGAYWPWWVTLFALAVVLWRVFNVPAAAPAAAGFAVLALVGFAAKRAIERAAGTES